MYGPKLSISIVPFKTGSPTHLAGTSSDATAGCFTSKVWYVPANMHSKLWSLVLLQYVASCAGENVQRQDSGDGDIAPSSWTTITTTEVTLNSTTTMTTTSPLSVPEITTEPEPTTEAEPTTKQKTTSKAKTTTTPLASSSTSKPPPSTKPKPSPSTKSKPTIKPILPPTSKSSSSSIHTTTSSSSTTPSSSALPTSTTPTSSSVQFSTTTPVSTSSKLSSSSSANSTTTSHELSSTSSILTSTEANSTVATTTSGDATSSHASTTRSSSSTPSASLRCGKDKGSFKSTPSKKQRVSNLDGCKSACKGDGDCKSFEFGTLDGSDNNCWFFDKPVKDLEIGAPQKGFTWAFWDRDCEESSRCGQEGSFLTKPTTKSKVSDVEACKSACQKDGNCQTFEFGTTDHSDNNCWLFDKAMWEMETTKPQLGFVWKFYDRDCSVGE